jgi:predicted Ser/Thr protein kinase
MVNGEDKTPYRHEGDRPMATSPVLEKFQKKYFDKEFRSLTWSGTFEEYLDVVKKNPRILRTSYQRLYDMILSFGTQDYEDSRKKMIHYNFFDDPVDNGKDAIYGLDAYLMKLMNALKSAAFRYGTEKRVLLLHGPVGSSKSTIVRLMKRAWSTIPAPRMGRSIPTNGSISPSILMMRNIPCGRPFPAPCIRIRCSWSLIA